MKPKMKWLIPERVLYWKLSGNISTEEFLTGLNKINTILEAGKGRIHVIADARYARTLVGETRHIRQVARSAARNANMGCFFVISNSFMFKHQLNMLTVDFGTHLRYTDSFRNSWYSLHNVDRSLPYVAPEQPTFAKARKYV